MSYQLAAKASTMPKHARERDVRAMSGALRRGSLQTGVSQSAGSCRILLGQGRIDPGLGAVSCRILQDPSHWAWFGGCRTFQDFAGVCKAGLTRVWTDPGQKIPEDVKWVFVQMFFSSGIAKNNLGESFYRPWVPFVTTIFLFIFGSNWSGALVPWKLLELPEGELAAPTNNINTTVALSLLTSIAYFGGGLVKKGLGYFARYVKPTPILLPINILEDFTKPLSLSFRLFGNVLADELTVAVLTFLVPFVIPLPIMALGIFAGSIQALIFATLASAYIAEAIE
ncbi:unnamed protein product [Prorocentrum cordatum]|uniref:ATP synthase subunit a, chloroplastic n=1 Tax=Prorocentrum cordatum TaxID=2364126 RepID=A0ABN9UCQ3_9DINO|nr:unnamed protein product [Polarella glacialis]